MTIHVLPDALISQIAAGEVIERPAAVIKELVENALDAGATTITIRVNGGGRVLLQVSDDGSGIPSAETILACTRHATSKLSSFDDLFAMSTLGFRGEALASIAAVSQMRLVTRHASESIGTQLVLSGGKVVEQTSVASPVGTLIAVENLFFNVPARLKFLKSDSSERSHIARIVSRYALAYPSVRFRFYQDERLSFQTHGTGQLLDAILAAYGEEVAQQLLLIHTDDGAGAEVEVEGFCSPPGVDRANRGEMSVFVNGRWVQDQSLQSAILQAYRNFLLVGRFPIAIVMLRVPAADVDVNVHPAKTEVRFRNPNVVFGAVQRAIRQTLLHQTTVPGMTMPLDSVPSRDEILLPIPSAEPIVHGTPLPPPVVPSPVYQGTLPSSPAVVVDVPVPQAENVIPMLRVLGQIGAAYVVAEGPDGLYLVDQHAAHERILFEAFLEQAQRGKPVETQLLLQAVSVEVPPTAVPLLLEQWEVLARLGFVVEQFGRQVFLVRGLPSVLGPVDPAAALLGVVGEFEEDETPLAGLLEARLIARVCKRAAVKAGQVLTRAEQLELVQALERCQSPRTCPHGRPTMVHLSVSVLEKQFRRR